MRRLRYLALAFFLIIFSCGKETAQDAARQADAGSVVTVVASFEALKEFAVAVGGDKAGVTVIVPPGMEAHDFEPKARDLAALAKAAVFVYNGLGLEGWAEQALAASGGASLIAVEASRGFPVITAGGALRSKGADPHLWLSLEGAAAEAANIKDALVKADPANGPYYEKNYAEFAARLDALRTEYAEKFSHVQKKQFVTGHAAFAYLCREFGLEQNSVEDVFAEGEPSARQLAALADYCRQNGVKVIFAEEAASPEVSATLAREVGARLETIDTIESPGEGSYLVRMEENLAKIYASLSE